jgi:hypothetical protein
MTARDPPLDFGPSILKKALDRIFKIFTGWTDEFCYPVNPVKNLVNPV